MAGPGICVLCLADTCTSDVHPVFNLVAPYGYLLSDMYLFMADITNPDFLVWSCRTWIGLDITRFCEQQRQPSSGSAWPACPKNGKPPPHNTPFPWVLMKSIGASFLQPDALPGVNHMRGMQYQIVLNIIF